MHAAAKPVEKDCYVAGDWRAAQDGRRFDVTDPATGELIDSAADASPVDGLAAIAAAHDAFQLWSRVAPRERGEILRRAFELMIGRADDLTRLVVTENGKALADARAEVAYAAEFFRWNSEEAVRISGEIVTAPAGTSRILVFRQPIGVALLVTPWNFPAAMLTRKIGPALATGCTVVCKPARETPFTALAIAAILDEAGTPPGVVNVVPSSRPGPLIDAVIADGRVRKLSFTGSTEIGRALLAKASERVLSCSMELGGNAPFIVFGDADLDAAVAGAMVAKMRNGGEACTAANRFYVEESISSAFSTRLAAAMAEIRMGHGLEEGVGLGPLVNVEARNKVATLVAGALEAGARLLTGGVVPDGPGYFYPATVLDRVAPGSPILKEEIFGPVAPIVSFQSESEVIELANDSILGLVSYVYTADLARGLRVAEALETGMVGLNRGLVSDPAAPFGGVKQSGLGREGGHEGMSEFLETKYVACSW